MFGSVTYFPADWPTVFRIFVVVVGVVVAIGLLWLFVTYMASRVEDDD